MTLDIQKNVSLKRYNTFGIEVFADEFIEINSIEQLQEALKLKKDFFILGGGSNMLLTQNIKKCVLYINLKGIEIINEDKEFVFVKVQAGEVWHEFVLWCIANNYGGLENLSLIPGSVGASPIQNIGAHGVEIKDCFYKLKAIEIATGKRKVFELTDCNFGYRNSIFKQELKGKYIITSVIYKLTKSNHKLNLSYGTVQSELDAAGITSPTIKDVSDIIIGVRSRKLPDPKEIGNSGSFFKNPVIPITLFEKIKAKYPEVPSYPISDTEIKVPAGWLIEKSGFKGQRFGEAGVHKNQALVLVNYGDATGDEVYKVAQNIQAKVKELFNIALEIEVNVI